MPEMAADPLPPSAMAQPGTLNLNNEVSARAEIVGCGAPSRCLLRRGQRWGAGLPVGCGAAEDPSRSGDGIHSRVGSTVSGSAHFCLCDGREVTQ